MDKEGILWVGAINGLYHYDNLNDRFILFNGNHGLIKIDKVLHVTADNQDNLWISTSNNICRINPDRNTIRISWA